MNREIKFRGKDNGHWVYGDYTHGGYFNPETGLEIRHIISSDFLHDVDPHTIGQYTGLHDKNGKEIYEGDIVTIMRKPVRRFKEVLTRHIVISDSVTCWTFKSLTEDVLSLCMMGYTEWDSFKFEVIGNIYDNPELSQPYSLNLPEPKQRKKRNKPFKIEFIVKD